MSSKYLEQSDNVKRYPMTGGSCDWCGQQRKTLFDYRAPGHLDYRLDKPTHKFCNKGCYLAYWS